MGLRQAEMRDIEQMVVLLQELFAIEEDFNVNEKLQRQGMRKIMEDSSAYVLVWEEHDTVIAMGTMQEVISTAEGGTVGLVEDIVVRHDAQARGIGRAIVRGLIDEARRRGYGRLQLLADRENIPALNFYAKCEWMATRLICMRKMIGHSRHTAS